MLGGRYVVLLVILSGRVSPTPIAYPGRKMALNGQDDVLAAAAAQAAVAGREKPSATVNINAFDSSKDDFEKWVELFESAVKLATNTTGDRLHELCLAWLPHKLDEAARSTREQAEKVSWPELKEELMELLVDPQERYKWQARQIKIKWDGKESLHQLSTRVKRMVHKYDKKMPQEFKDRECFLRFLGAFKKPMRRFIYMACPEGQRTIETAKDVAMRYQLSTLDDDGESEDEGEAFKAVAFAGEKLQPDRATGIETALAGITTQLENVSVSMRKMEEKVDQRIGNLERRMGQVEAAGGQAGQSWNTFGGPQAPQQSNNGPGWQGNNYGRGRSFHRGRGGFPGRRVGFSGPASRGDSPGGSRGGGQFRGNRSNQRRSGGRRGGGFRGGQRGGSFHGAAIETEDEYSQDEEDEEDPEQEYEDDDYGQQDWNYCTGCDGWGVN